MKKNQKGITLVALVITIIILLILAGISISQLVASGLFERARKSEEESKKSQNLENSILGDYEKTIDGYLTENITDITGAQSNDMLEKTTNTKVQDEYGNQIVVPAGFKITNDAVTANNGIVIIDKSQNEFVWIPVPTDGKIYTNTEKNQYKTVKLNRYTFNGNGEKTAHDEDVIETFFQELSISDKGNTPARDISEFKTSVEKNKGYYIGRYEARKTDSNELTLKASDNIYNNIYQSTAAEKCKNMYDNTKSFKSDLVNSYAWDTATLFLQECGTNSKYSIQTSITSSISTTGTNNQTAKDVQCNIYDMASNVYEFTTETSSYSTFPCVTRGGVSGNSNFYTSIRDDNYGSNGADINVGFRPILYL